MYVGARNQESHNGYKLLHARHGFIPLWTVWLRIYSVIYVCLFLSSLTVTLKIHHCMARRSRHREAMNISNPSLLPFIDDGNDNGAFTLTIDQILSQRVIQYNNNAKKCVCI